MRNERPLFFIFWISWLRKMKWRTRDESDQWQKRLKNWRGSGGRCRPPVGSRGKALAGVRGRSPLKLKLFYEIKRLKTANKPLFELFKEERHRGNIFLSLAHSHTQRDIFHLIKLNEQTEKFHDKKKNTTRTKYTRLFHAACILFNSFMHSLHFWQHSPSTSVFNHQCKCSLIWHMDSALCCYTSFQLPVYINLSELFSCLYPLWSQHRPPKVVQDWLYKTSLQ